MWTKIDLAIFEKYKNYLVMKNYKYYVAYFDGVKWISDNGLILEKVDYIRIDLTD